MDQPYSDYDSNPLFAQPAHMKNGTLDAFVLVADMPTLAGFVDRRLDAPTGGIAGLRPLAPVVLATFAHYGHAASVEEPYASRGYVDYHELAFWVFLVATRDAPNAPRGSVFVWNPYLYVDDHLALIGGRELFGFDKKMGEITMPDAGSPQAPAVYAATTRGHLVYERGNRAATLPVMTARRVDGAAPELTGETWSDLGGLVSGVLGALGHPGESLAERLRSALSDIWLDLDILGHLTVDILEKRVPGLTFKQTRSALDPDRADLKLLLNGANQIESLSAQLMGGSYEATLPHSASEPIARDLGLSEAPPVLLAFRAEIDGVMGSATQVWPAL